MHQYFCEGWLNAHCCSSNHKPLEIFHLKFPRVDCKWFNFIQWSMTVLRAASSDVPASIPMDHDSVHCVSPPRRTGEHLCILTNSNNYFNSLNNADTGLQRGLYLEKNLLDLTIYKSISQVVVIRSWQA